jgi:hypothetical protein
MFLGLGGSAPARLAIHRAAFRRSRVRAGNHRATHTSAAYLPTKRRPEITNGPSRPSSATSLADPQTPALLTPPRSPAGSAGHHRRAANGFRPYLHRRDRVSTSRDLPMWQ